MSQQHDRAMADQARQQAKEDRNRLEQLKREREQIERDGHVKDSKRYMEVVREMEQAERDAAASKTSRDKLQDNYDKKHGNR